MTRQCLGVGLGLLLACSQAKTIDYYVAKNGNNDWSGRLAEPNSNHSDGPFATLSRARDEVRKLKSRGPLQSAVTIYVRGGIYFLSHSFKLEAQDSGTAADPIVYRGYKNERPVLVGGREIRGFKPYKGHILQANVVLQGLKGVYFRQLLFGGKRQHLARYPNWDPKDPYGGGWAYVAGHDIPAYKDVPGDSRRTFRYKPSDAREWSHPDEGEVVIFPRYNWGNNIIRIASIDRAKRTITLAHDASYAIRPGNRYYVRNLFEELDAPGEWYLSKRKWILYFWPPAVLRSKPVFVPTTRTVVKMGDGAANIIWRNFEIEGAEGTAMRLEDTTDCLIAANIIHDVGGFDGSGIEVTGGFHNGVVGNDIYQTGKDGIIISGGNRKTLTAGENFADNNYIHNVGVLNKAAVGISLRGVGNRASHNLIEYCPRTGIGFEGNNLVIEYNEIDHVVLETEDAGAINTGGRDWISSRGSVVRYNFVHDVIGYGYRNGKWLSPFLAWGIYLDDNTGGVDVIGNIVADAPRAGIFLHNGRDNHIENNILVDNGLQQLELHGWTKDSVYWRRHLPTMIKGYEMVANEPAWRNMRNMDISPRKAVLPDGLIMTGNEFLRNIIYYHGRRSRLFSFQYVPLHHYRSDFNLVYHFGEPLLTGEAQGGKELLANLVPNPGFAGGGANALPKGWRWQIDVAPAAEESVSRDSIPAWRWRRRSLPMTSGGMVRRPDGERALRIHDTGDRQGGRHDHPIVVSREFSLQSGHYYRISAEMRATSPDTTGRIMLQWYDPSVGFFGAWTSYPRDVKVGLGWKEHEFVCRILGPGDLNYEPEMKRFRFRIDFMGPTGSLFVTDVAVHEIEVPDEWASWRAMGFDTHSVVADPLFVNAADGDYRLKRNSPAFKLGFKPIPIAQIGPYKDALRATWPIVQAEDAPGGPLQRTAR